MTPVRVELRAGCAPQELFAHVERLDRYPEWLDLVRSARAEGPDRWVVVLTARLGPLRRSKQLTMVRTEHVAPSSVRFERAEPDGRPHAAWVLEAHVEPEGDGSRLTMLLHYDGQWFGPLLERVLTDQIEAARPRLLALVDRGAGGRAACEG